MKTPVNQARQTLTIIRKLVGTTWRTDEQIVDHEGTPKSSHICMSAYRTITWKANYKATPRTD